MKASVVIGANFGDEGKGRITDYLAQQANRQLVQHGNIPAFQLPTVVRFNGGAQAGHTVVTPDGKRHVFGHFSSGSFQGNKTFLARRFVANPVLFVAELKKLTAIGVAPQVWVDPRVIITTPYDMMINQAHENFLGKKRSGSCGVGFNETIEREQHFVDPYDRLFKLDVTDLYDTELLFYKLQLIRREWFPHRCKKLGIPLGMHMNDKILWQFMEDVEVFKKNITVKSVGFIKNDHLIFEGAQGLGLDQEQGMFPHVTRSYTGLTNVLEFCREVKTISELDIYYVTRAYNTRHGNGPLERETIGRTPYSKIIETTNVKNQYQGVFRYGYLDTNKLQERITTDLSNPMVAAGKLKANIHLAITCMDQLGKEARYYHDGKLKRMKTDVFPRRLATDIFGLGFNVSVIVSSSPCSVTTHAKYIDISNEIHSLGK